MALNKSALNALLLAGCAISLPAAALARDAVAEAAPATSAVDPAVIALAEVPRGRLTDAVTPKAYRIDTAFDPSAQGFTGSTQIDVTLKAPSRFVDLHGRNLVFDSATAWADGKTWTGRWHEIDPSGVGRLVFDEALPAGPVTLTFTYSGKYQDASSGLFRTEIDGKWYGWSQFQSIDARAAFPSFDEPGVKVPFTVTIRTRPGEVAISNAPEVSSALEGGWQVHRFAPTLPLPTYLVAMMSGPFAVAEGTVPPTPQRPEPLPLRIVAPHTSAGKLSYALEESKPIVSLLEDYFGTRFPYPKLDQIASPLMGGAMENAGADLYNDTILILDSDAPVWQRKIFGMVVAHELSHQWFGDLVTPAWWDDIWLNESFANWMGFTIGGAWKPELKIADGALGEGFAAMGTDALLAGRPIHQPIPTNDRIDSAFDSITYGKGGHVVAMIAAFMGPEKFRDGVRRYMAAHRYGNATSKDFFAAMAEAAGDPRITAAMQSFTDQQGVPLVTVSGGPGNWRVAQARYAPIGVTAPATRWGVPVCLRSGAERACTLLADDSATLSLSANEPLMPNAGGTGYYRFELPAAEWDRLIAAGNSLSEAEAMAMTDSLGASFRAGRATPAQMLKAAQVLAANPNGGTVLRGLQLVDGLRKLVSDTAAQRYRGWLGRLAAARLVTVGSDVSAGVYAGEDPQTQELRQGLLFAALAGRDPGTLTKLAAAGDAYLGDDAKAVDPAYLSAAVEAILKRDGVAAAKRLADKALASEDALVRPSLIAAIFESGDPVIARWALSEWSDKRLRPVEKLRGAFGVIGNTDTRDIGYEWLVANIDTVMKASGGIFLARAVPGALAGFCSTDKADEFEARLGPVLATTPGALEFARTLERIRNCAALKATRGAEAEAVLSAL